MRRCRDCDQEKPSDAFYASSKFRCKECVKDRVRRWQLENPEKYRQIQRRWQKNNADADRQRRREAARTPEARRRRREYTAKWRAANPDKMRIYSLRSWERRRTGFRIGALSEWAEVLYHDPCSYCGGPAGELDHIVPVVAGGIGDADNLASACRSCNAQKYTRPLLAFLLER